MSGAVCLVYGCATEEDEENNGYVLRCTGVNDENPTGSDCKMRVNHVMTCDCQMFLSSYL